MNSIIRCDECGAVVVDATGLVVRGFGTTEDKRPVCNGHDDDDDPAFAEPGTKLYRASDGGVRTLVVNCPFPDHAVSNNGRLSWPARARKTRELRKWGQIAAFEGLGRLDHVARTAFGVAAYPDPGVRLIEQFTVDWELVAPPKVRWDDDNAISACKPLRDGIADALGINDRKITTGRVWWRDPKPGEPHSAIAHIRSEP